MIKNPNTQEECCQNFLLKLLLFILALQIYVYAAEGLLIGNKVEYEVTQLPEKSFSDVNDTSVSYAFRCERLTENTHLSGWPYVIYYDNQMSTSYNLVFDNKIFPFVVCQNAGQVWAISKDYRESSVGLHRIAVQITDFLGADNDGVEVDDDCELDTVNGIFYIHTRQDYDSSTNDKTTSPYRSGPGISTVFAINIKELLLDVLGDSVETNRRSYYTKICNLAHQTNIKDCGWGVVYDWESSYLYVAATNMTSDPSALDTTDTILPSRNFIYRIEIEHPISFGATSFDSMGATIVGDYPTTEIQLAHFMINPWDPKILAIDNYAFSKTAGNPTVNPSSCVIFNFHYNSSDPIVTHLLLPENYNARNGFTHMSFVNENALILSHRHENRGLFVNYPSVSSQSDVKFGKVWANRYDYHVNRGVVHGACSKDMRFIVSDMGITVDSVQIFDSLFLWFQTSETQFCVPFVDQINQEIRVNNENPHPHASFIDDNTGQNRIIIFNVRDPGPTDSKKPEVWQFRIPNDIYDRTDLIPFRSVPFKKSIKKIIRSM